MSNTTDEKTSPEASCAPPPGSAPRETQTASRWVWWIAMLAMNQPYPRLEPKVGDTVVETTHLVGLARHRLGLHKACGELLAIEVGEFGNRYLIKPADPEEPLTWWENAMITVIEQNNLLDTPPQPNSANTESRTE